MNALGGIECFTTFHCLKRGKAIERCWDDTFYVVQYGDGTRQTHIAAFVHHSHESALKACEENAEYWEGQAKLLREELKA